MSDQTHTPRRSRHRVLFIESGTGYGGSISFLCSLLSHLDRRRFDPVVAFYTPSAGPCVDRIRGLGVPIVFVDRGAAPRHDWFAASVSRVVHGSFARFVGRLVRISVDLLTVHLPRTWSMLRYLERESFVLVVLNNDVHYHVPGALAAALARVPLVCRKAGGIGEGRWIKKLLTPRVELFIAISKATEADQRMQSSTKRVVTIYGGVDVERFRPRPPSTTLRSKLGLPAGHKVVGSLARFELGKGQLELLRAAANVLCRYPNVVFVVGGGHGPDNAAILNQLEIEARRLGIADHVILTGWHDDVPAFLSVLDVFVHVPTTVIEGLGIANLEAMAMAKPTVVSRNGGLPDAVSHGVTGFVVPPGDTEALSDVLLRLLTDERLARRLGQNARRHVEEHFDIAKNVRRMERVFEDVVPGAASRPRSLERSRVEG